VIGDVADRPRDAEADLNGVIEQEHEPSAVSADDAGDTPAQALQRRDVLHQHRVERLALAKHKAVIRQLEAAFLGKWKRLCGKDWQPADRLEPGA